MGEKLRKLPNDLGIFKKGDVKVGGYNSGPYSFSGKTGKMRVSQCYAIDVRRWKRDGLLFAGISFSWSWTNKNGNKAEIGVNMPEDDKIKLSYIVTREGVKTPVESLISLGFSECNYGSRRYWFHCPECLKRVALLYLRGAQFKCRHCHDLTYGSCQESGNKNDEQERRVNRVLTKLKNKNQYGFDIMFYNPHRPKGMHWGTWLRLRQEFWDEQMIYMVGINGTMDRLNNRILQ
jgi:hypothetical protein